jgi:hypothetical protein
MRNLLRARPSDIPTAAAIGALSLCAFALAAAPAVASAAADNSDVAVLHGVPGLTADVFANGEEILSDFEPGSLSDTLSLPAGDYDLAVFPAGEGPDGEAAIEANDVAVPAGANITVVAHLDAEGNPVLTPFVNDTSRLAAGQARLTVRHTAAAPAVLAGTDTVAIGPADLDLAEGANTIVYAWGAAEDDNLDLAVQTISGLHSAPSGVPSGTGGLVDDGIPAPLVGVSLLALVGAALAGRRVAAQRR